MKIQSGGAELLNADGQMNKREANSRAFRNFANAPKN
jgi:hypothetical protein